MLNVVLDFLFPKMCTICGKQVDSWVCEKCRKRLKKVENLKVLKNTNNNSFNNLIYLYKYNKIIRKIIHEYKFYDKPYISKFFSTVVLENFNLCSKLKKYDAIVPVPIHKSKMSKRGYNQSELIAKEITEKLNIKIYSDLLYKKENTKEQKLLNKYERIMNVKNVYGVRNEERIKGKEILLFDDVFTTGATVGECSKILLQNGVKKVDVLVIAKD